MSCRGAAGRSRATDFPGLLCSFSGKVLLRIDLRDLLHRRGRSAEISDVLPARSTPLVEFFQEARLTRSGRALHHVDPILRSQEACRLPPIARR